MSKFRVGQRIKKVRGRSCVGVTATVVAVGCTNWHPLFQENTLQILTDRPIQSNQMYEIEMATEVYTNPEWWEPLTPPHVPASTEFTEALNSGDLSSWLAKERVT